MSWLERDANLLLSYIAKIVKGEKMKSFDYDSPIMTFFTRIMDLVFLNVLIIVFSIPLITIGTATTAGHYTALKIHREEGKIWDCFWRTFKENIRQSTGIWVLFCVYVFIAVTFYNVALKIGGNIAHVVAVIIVIALLFIAIIYIWVIPLQARFVNPIKVMFKNSLYMTFRYLVRTLLMAVFTILPIGTLVVCFLTTKMGS